MLEQELNEFGRRMGLPGLSFSPDGLAALDVERMGRLHLEKGGKPGAEELLVYLARPCPAHDREAPERALELCHYRHPRPFPLSAGVHGISSSCSPACRSGKPRRPAWKKPCSCLPTS